MQWRKVAELFEQVVDLPAADRDARLAAGDHEDREICDEVRALVLGMTSARRSLQLAVGAAAAAFMDGAPRLQIGRRLGPYRLVELIGEGGMGAVYLAERDDAQYQRQVAIKIVRQGYTEPQMVSRFLDERQILASLEHPSIVRLLDGGTTDDGMPYLVMEHVQGTPLTRFVAEQPIRSRVELTIRIAGSLQYAHQKLVVHRDIKPSNILVDADGTPKLLDFGIAKLLGPTASSRAARTRTGSSMFTPEYASPEQTRGEPASVASDVYSLGAVFYEVLTGRPPVPAGVSGLELLRSICEVAPPRPSLVAPPRLQKELIGDLDNVVLKALQKVPERRYASVQQFADDLERYLAGMPVSARKATLRYRAHKFVARHRGPLTLTVLILAALLTLTVVSLRQARRADEQARRADEQTRATQRQTRVLLEEQGRRELLFGHADRALLYIAEVLRQGDDTPAIRLLLAEATRPADRAIRTMSEGHGGIGGVAWSPDGRYLAATGADGMMRIYDAQGTVVRELRGSSDWLLLPAFSPDGGVLAAQSRDKQLHVWDMATGALRFTREASGLDQPSFDRSAARVAAGDSGDNGVNVWRVSDGALVRHVAAVGGVRCVALSPDGSVVAAGSTEGKLVIWEVGSGRLLQRGEAGPGESGRLLQRGEAEPGENCVLRFSVDGARLYHVTGQQLHIWSGREWKTVMSISSGEVVAIDLSLDGATLVTASNDGAARVWNARSGALQVSLVGPGPMQVRDARFSRDGTRVVTTGRDNTFRLWNSRSGELELTLEPGAVAGSSPHSHSGALTAQFSPDGRTLLTASGSELELWRVTREPLVTEVAIPGVPQSAQLSPDETQVAVVGFAGLAGVWDVASGRRLAEFQARGKVWDVGWSPDAKRILMVGEYAFAEIVSADGSGPALQLLGHRAMINHGSFSPDGRRVVTACDDHTARIWDAASGGQLLELAGPDGHQDRVLSATWNPAGTLVATAGWDRTLRIWDAKTGGLVRVLNGTNEFLDVAFSPDGRWLASTGHDGVAQVWDWAAGVQHSSLIGHTGPISEIAWSPDGALIATSAGDRTARIWDPMSGKELAVRNESGSVMSVAWSRDGSRILTAVVSGVVRIWDVHRDERSLGQIIALADRLPWKLIDGQLEYTVVGARPRSR